MKRPFMSEGFWIAVLVLVVLVVAICLSVRYWDWLSGPSGTTVRNIGLVIASVIAILLAFWRSRVAGRQADAAQRQSETAQGSLMNERYQKGAELLGSDVLSVRLGGIYALQRLANDYPEHYQSRAR